MEPGNKPKTVYYSDPQNDDFAGTKIKACCVDEHFIFVNTNIFWNAAAFLLYHIIARPLVFLYCKIAFGLKIVNRCAVKRVRSGFFLYGNHTNVIDVFIPNLVAFPRRVSIISSPDAVSIKGIRQLVMMLGALPLSCTPEGKRKFRKAVELRCRRNQAVAIFPEAHIWPYYTGIREFSPRSFRYPVDQNRPAIAMTTVYRPRKVLKFLRRPQVTVIVSDPFYPDASLSRNKAMQKLRDQVYRSMLDASRSIRQAEYIRYEARAADGEVSRSDAGGGDP